MPSVADFVLLSSSTLGLAPDFSGRGGKFVSYVLGVCRGSGRLDDLSSTPAGTRHTGLELTSSLFGGEGEAEGEV